MATELPMAAPSLGRPLMPHAMPGLIDGQPKEGNSRPSYLKRRRGLVPSRKLTYLSWGKGKSSSNMPFLRGYVSFRSNTPKK